MRVCVCAFVRSEDGGVIFAGMAELVLLELSLLIEIAWDPLNWKIWFEEAAGSHRGNGEASRCRVPFPPVRSSSARCVRHVRISGAALDAPHIGPEEDPE